MFENDYNITGKHASYLKFLAAKNSGAKGADDSSPTSARIFERYIDVYMNAAIWGCCMKELHLVIPHQMTEQEYMPMPMLRKEKTAYSCIEW